MSSGVFDLRDAESYSAVRRASRCEKIPLAMVEGFDAASVVATSDFVASGKQPFTSDADLKSLDLPVLLVRGDDPLHPSEVSDLYAANIRDCTEVASSADASEAIGAFCDRCARTWNFFELFSTGLAVNE